MDATLALIIIVGAVLYFLPTIAARGGDRVGPVFVVNLFFGWTLLGWVVAFVMAASSKEVRQMRSCPACAEEVLAEAQVCRYCGHSFPAAAPDEVSSKGHLLKLAAIALAIGALVYGLTHARITGFTVLPFAAAPAVPAVQQQEQQSQRRPLVIVPDPDPASAGILLDAWAKSRAPLVPLVP